MKRTSVIGLVLAAMGCVPDEEPSGGLASGIAVVSSDYDSTSIALLEPATGTIVRDGCLHSGTRAPGLSLALSGDVTIPADPNGQGELVIVDRAYAAVTWLDPKTCTPLRQLAVGTGYAANPHDLVTVSATKAYVTRYDRNPSPTPAPDDFDDGDDLLVIDPSVPRVVGRIDLGAYADTIDGVKLVARPERAVRARGKVYVVLGHQSVDFQREGRGKVVEIDPASDTVTRVLELPEPLRVCGGIDFDEETGRLAVVCGGAFSAVDVQRSQSGVALVDLDEEPPAMEVVPASELASRPLNFEFVTFTDGGGVVVGTAGSVEGIEDELVAFGAGAPRRVLAAGEPFVVGHAVADREAARLFVPLASEQKPRIVGYRLAADGTLSDEVEIAPSVTGLPPRQMARF